MVKRKDTETHSPSQNKRTRKVKVGDFSDDEDLSDLEDGEVFNGIRIPSELPPIVSAEENIGPRMVIKNIVANNFKSYYGQVIIGPFHKSLTSIVGANGSGKSNVIDSLLFVFGYRSTKIRSKKVSVLLHKSDKHKDVHQCSVTVNFVLIHDDDNVETGFTSIPGTEITITRTAFKDNTSFYTLNNKRVKFKEIANVLKKNGIDLIHNRFLILQGEVEQIAMMKPKAENDHSTGMLEYLEDVIGTVRYKKPIKKLEEKVNELSLEKNEKITRLKFYAKERDDLLEPVQDVVRYLKLDNKAIQLQNKLFQKNIREVNKKIDTESEKELEIEEKLRLIKDELEEIKKSKKEKERLIRRLNEQLKIDGIKKEDFDKQIKLLTNEENNLKAHITRIENDITKLEGTIKQEKNKINKNKRLPETKEVERKRLQSQLVPLEEECTKLEMIYNKINKNGFEKSKKFREEKDLLVPEEIRLEEFVGVKQNHFQALITKFEILIDTEKTEREKLISMEEQMTKENDAFLDNTRKKEAAEVEIRNCKSVIDDLEKDLENLKKDEDQIKTKLQNIRHSLSEKRTAYAETTERSRPIQFIINLKEKREILGILGRCGDYGQVEGKYDIPACTACGSTDQVVVEHTVAANECIKRLRQSNAGRLTFSILPEIQRYKPRADANNNYPENARRVFDLIEILDQRFRLTFYAGLYDTLLADDLEQARRIAFGTQTRYRVVTYKGDLIDQSGLMSGGGRPIKGKIGPQETRAKYGNNNSQVSQNDVEKLDKIAKDLEVQLKETQSKIYECQNNIESNRKKINDELSMIVKQCLIRINSWKEKEDQVKSIIKTQKLVIAQKKIDPIVVANEEKAIKKAATELEDAKVEFNKVKSKVDSLKKKIEEITEEEPREAKRLFDEASENLEKTRREINKINVDIEAAAKKITLSEEKIETQKARINESKESIESMRNNLKINHESLVKIKEEFDEIKANLVEQKKNLEESKNTNDENDRRQNKLLVEEMNLKQDIGKVKQNLEQHKGRQKQFKDALSKLKLHEIPEIDVIHRDPVMESYQNRNTKGQITATLDAVNDKEECEKDDQNWIHVDENKDEDKDNNLDSMELPIYTNEQLDEQTETNITMLRNSIDESMKDLKPNMNILNEYKKRVQQYNEKADEVAEILKIYNDHTDMINKVRQRRRDEFMASFKKITIKLKEMYQMITLGGDAELELVDSLDPFSEGVNFSVRPPKKTWKVISNLSGGEKTLSSLALVFALHYYKPSPLYVMDEIDAALDFKNVSIIAYYIKERTKNSQFIIISLRSNMFEKADLLVGIYKTNDCTDTTSVRTKDYVNVLEGALTMYSKNREAKKEFKCI